MIVRIFISPTDFKLPKVILIRLRRRASINLQQFAQAANNLDPGLSSLLVFHSPILQPQVLNQPFTTNTSSTIPSALLLALLAVNRQPASTLIIAFHTIACMTCRLDLAFSNIELASKPSSLRAGPPQINKSLSHLHCSNSSGTLLDLNAIFRRRLNFDVAKGVRKVGSFRRCGKG